MQTKEPKTECGKSNRHSDSDENVDEFFIHIQELFLSAKVTPDHYRRTGDLEWRGINHL
jgi:hypothetical protein